MMWRNFVLPPRQLDSENYMGSKQFRLGSEDKVSMSRVPDGLVKNLEKV